jgi:hypothetical protein
VKNSNKYLSDSTTIRHRINIITDYKGNSLSIVFKEHIINLYIGIAGEWVHLDKTFDARWLSNSKGKKTALILKIDKN